MSITWLWLLLSLPCLAANEAVIGSARAFLEQQVSNYLQQNRLDGHSQVELAELDSRLSLKPCTVPLAISLEGRVPIGKLTLRVRCKAPGWTQFLPARVKILQRVLVAHHPLARGQSVQPDDVSWREHDISQLRHGWLSDLDSLQGKQLTRSLVAGQLLLGSHLKAAQLIAVHDQVQILAQSGGIRVRMNGVALSAGHLGQQIRVRNLTSKIVLRARVIAPGQVEAVR